VFVSRFVPSPIRGTSVPARLSFGETIAQSWLTNVVARPTSKA
jgi:hypothetical protein